MRQTLTQSEFVAVRRRIIFVTAIVLWPVSIAISIYDGLWQSTVGSHAHQIALNLLQSTGISIGVVVASELLLRHRFARHERWAVGGETPSEADVLHLVNTPVWAATWIFLFVSTTTVIITIADLFVYRDPVEGLGIGVGFFLAGFTFSVITYLQAERAMRPLFVLAMTGADVPPRRLLGVRPRLILAWMLGSALPLLFIIAIPLRPGRGNVLPITVPMLYMAIGGLLLGGIVTMLAARSVAEPIEEVRTGLRHVRDGDVDQELEVTNPGDLGQLLAGFNQMVSGLRERRTLEDLFGRHVGVDVARHALESGLALGGETRMVTTLFVDMVGSTEFAESHPPEVVVARINQMFQAVYDEVTVAGGWINKFEGDGCLCVFGAPTPLDDHCARGLAAARHLARRLRTLDIPVGIGVSCGDVVAGNVGSVERFEYTVIGTPVNEAARLTDAAKAEPGRVLASWQAVAAAGTESEHWVDHGELDLRGLRAPLRTAVPKEA